MSQPESFNPLDQSVGYAIKLVDSALRGAMDAVLRPLGLTVPQYACLELLQQKPGLSNAELARGAFVTRQSMNGVLRGLEDRGLVERPSMATHGRALPASLTTAGMTLLEHASRDIVEVERRMLRDLDQSDTQNLLTALRACVTALTTSQQEDPVGVHAGQKSPT